MGLPSPLSPLYSMSKVVVVVQTIKVRIVTAIVPPGCMIHNRTVVVVELIVVPVSGGER